MRAEMDHRTALLESSARWDGEHEPRLSDAVDDHLATCASCRSAVQKMARARRILRLQEAATPPDLTGSIMREITGADTVRSVRSNAWRERLTVAAVAASISALVISGASLPWDRSSDLAGAAEVSQEIRAAARELTSYRATYEVTETGWHPQVSRRSFTTEVNFAAPERLSVRIHDTTAYPEGPWPRNDVTLRAGPRRWWIREPSTCPPEALPDCASSGVETRALVGRAPFDGDTLPPTDIVVPIESLASSGAFTVEAVETMAGRDVYRLAADHLSIEPLVAALQPGGSWVRFAPEDRATIWVDRATWFPVALEIDSADSDASLTVRLVRLHDGPRFETVPRTAAIESDGGFRDVSLTPRWAPTSSAGLDPYRTGRVGRTKVISYSSGLTWLRVTRATDPGRGPSLAEEVRVADGVGYYSPADERGARRVDLFDGEVRFRIEGNLARHDLLRVAGSIPVTGRSLGRSTATPGWFGAPAWLPADYAAAAVVRLGTDAFSVYYRHPEMERAAYGIRLTRSRERAQLTPSSEEFVLVDVSGRPARWSHERGELEWIDSGYRAVAAPGLGLATAVRIAESWAAR